MDLIERRKLERDTDRAIVRLAALTAWSQMSDNDKAIVRVGMIPITAVREHEPKGIEDSGRLFSVALMECAEADGGMIA